MTGAHPNPQINLLSDHDHRMTQPAHGDLPMWIFDLQSQKHEDFRAIDLTGLLSIERPCDNCTDFGAGIGSPFVQTFVNQSIGGLQRILKANLALTKNLGLIKPAL